MLRIQSAIVDFHKSTLNSLSIFLCDCYRNVKHFLTSQLYALQNPPYNFEDSKGRSGFPFDETTTRRVYRFSHKIAPKRKLFTYSPYKMLQTIQEDSKCRKRLPYDVTSIRKSISIYSLYHSRT